MPANPRSTESKPASIGSASKIRLDGVDLLPRAHESAWHIALRARACQVRHVVLRHRLPRTRPKPKTKRCFNSRFSRQSDKPVKLATHRPCRAPCSQAPNFTGRFPASLLPERLRSCADLQPLQPSSALLLQCLSSSRASRTSSRCRPRDSDADRRHRGKARHQREHGERHRRVAEPSSGASRPPVQGRSVAPHASSDHGPRPRARRPLWID